MLKPLNDYALVKLDNADDYGFEGNTKDTAETGILVDVPDLTHYGFYSFAFEVSLGNAEVLESLIAYWKGKIGQRVFWLSMSERGAILKDGEDRYCLVKFTSLIAEAEPESTARNLHGDGSGSFKG